MRQLVNNKSYMWISVLTTVILGLSLLYFSAEHSALAKSESNTNKSDKLLTQTIAKTKASKETLSSAVITPDTNTNMPSNVALRDFFKLSFIDMQSSGATAKTVHLKYGSDSSYQALVATFNGVGGFSNKLVDYDITLQNTSDSGNQVGFGTITIRQSQIRSGQEGTQSGDKVDDSIVKKSIYVEFANSGNNDKHVDNDNHVATITKLQLGDVQEAKNDANS